MRELLASLQANDHAALREIERLAHKIHGTAATLGHQTLSGCGGEIERFAVRVLSGELPLDAEACETLSARIDRLEAAAIQSVAARP
jgi:chemotaxis protein histidine kinase CheA